MKTVFVGLILKKLLKLNLYTDKNTVADENHTITRGQILATRVYLILFIILYFILLIFTILYPMTITTTIENPSEKTFKNLAANYPNTLSCPCKQNIMLHSTFISLQPIYHEVMFLIK